VRNAVGRARAAPVPGLRDRDSQSLWAVYNEIPVLAIDVYEHAYVADFGATPDGRKRYVEAFLRNLDWAHVNRQLEQAEAARHGADRLAPEPKG
jgi:superoxide dismutase